MQKNPLPSSAKRARRPTVRDYDAEAPEGWTKWVIPGYEYLYAERDSDPAFADVISYMQENHLSLAGAVHDFTCPKTGKNHMFFPVSKL